MWAVIIGGFIILGIPYLYINGWLTPWKVFLFVFFGMWIAIWITDG